MLDSMLVLVQVGGYYNKLKPLNSKISKILTAFNMKGRVQLYEKKNPPDTLNLHKHSWVTLAKEVIL